MSSRALAWSFVQQIGRQLANYGIFMVLAAILSPKDFGVLGMATAWLAFMGIFSELGFSVALIQKKDITPSHYSSTFYLNLAMGVILTALGAALAFPASRLLGIPEAGNVILALSGGLLISSFSITQSAMAQRAMRFKDLAKRDILASLGGGLIGIVLAWRGAGIWSLVAQTLAGNLLSTALLWRMSEFRPRLSEVSRERLRELWGYSSSLFYYNFFKYLMQNADRLLVGFFLGPEAVGLYTFANKLVLMPASALRGALGAYLFPLFARHQGDLDRVRRHFLDVNRAIGIAPVPALLLAGVLVPLLIPVLFGGKWDAAIPVIQIFTLVGSVQFLLAPVGELMKALGRPRWLLNWAVGFSAVTMALLAIGCQWDIATVGWSFALAHLLVLPANFALAGKLVVLRAGDIAGRIWPIAVFGLPVAGLSLAIRFVPGFPMAAWSTGVAAAMLAGGAALLYSQRGFLDQMRRDRREIKPAPGGPVPDSATAVDPA